MLNERMDTSQIKLGRSTHSPSFPPVQPCCAAGWVFMTVNGPVERRNSLGQSSTRPTLRLHNNPFTRDCYCPVYRWRNWGSATGTHICQAGKPMLHSSHLIWAAGGGMVHCRGSYCTGRGLSLEASAVGCSAPRSGPPHHAPPASSHSGVSLFQVYSQHREQSHVFTRLWLRAQAPLTPGHHAQCRPPRNSPSL